MQAVTRGTSSRDRATSRERFENESLVHLDALYRYALSLTRERADAEDLVSETVLLALDRWEQYQLGTNARAWLFTILHNAFVSRKRRARSREVRFPEDGSSGVVADIASDSDPEQTFYDSFLDDEITRALDALPPDFRRAVVLSDVQGFRDGALAAITGVPEGTVKSRLFRARRALQQKLAGYAVEMGYIKSSSLSCNAIGG